ncbi:MAG TPA: hypothetical protein VLC46_28250 [Thermoanaerobaculia bacterium]|jgi:hypothetical protein|nr:hypothetical protein [Thermoanaerobaculia bacterium]
MQLTLLVALIAFASGIVVSWLQHSLSRRLESAKTLSALRNEAYINLIKAISGLAIARRANNAEKELEFTILLIESKARIVMYGDPAIVESVARASGHASLSSPEAYDAIIEMIRTMRRHGGGAGRDEVSPEAISRLLFGGENERR